MGMRRIFHSHDNSTHDQPFSRVFLHIMHILHIQHILHRIPTKYITRWTRQHGKTSPALTLGSMDRRGWKWWCSSALQGLAHTDNPTASPTGEKTQRVLLWLFVSQAIILKYLLLQIKGNRRDKQSVKVFSRAYLYVLLLYCQNTAQINVSLLMAERSEIHFWCLL